MGLPDGENSLRICSLISTQYTDVKETQTDGRTHTDVARRHRPPYAA